MKLQASNDRREPSAIPLPYRQPARPASAWGSCRTKIKPAEQVQDVANTRLRTLCENERWLAAARSLIACSRPATPSARARPPCPRSIRNAVAPSARVDVRSCRSLVEVRQRPRLARTRGDEQDVERAEGALRRACRNSAVKESDQLATLALGQAADSLRRRDPALAEDASGPGRTDLR